MYLTFPYASQGLLLFYDTQGLESDESEVPLYHVLLGNLIFMWLITGNVKLNHLVFQVSHCKVTNSLHFSLLQVSHQV
jgi:hypothetical protein